MQAAVFEGDKKIRIGEMERPVAAPGEVLLKVRRTALCGSDTKLWLKGAAFTPGHEIFGVVEQHGHQMDGRRCPAYTPVLRPPGGTPPGGARPRAGGGPRAGAGPG